jgi:hypothetical protein
MERVAAHHMKSWQLLQRPCSVKSRKEHDWRSSACSMYIEPCNIYEEMFELYKKNAYLSSEG